MKSKFIMCECGTELLKLDRFEGEKEVYLTVFQYSSKRYSLFERIKILFGGKTIIADLVLSEVEFNKLKNF